MNDMSLMKKSELWKMAVDDRGRSLPTSQPSQKGKGKDKGKSKGKNKTFDPQKLSNLHQDHNGHLSGDRVEHVMLQKNVKSPAEAGAQSSTLAEERSRAKRKARPNHKRRRARSKERALERASIRKAHQTFPREGRGQRQQQERFHRWRIQRRLATCTLRQSQSYKRARYIRCFEYLVAAAGMSCLYRCHQRHRVEEAVYFWLPTSRSVCNLNSRQAPWVPALRLVGSSARCQTPFQRQRTTRSEPFYPSQSRHWE